MDKDEFKKNLAMRIYKARTAQRYSQTELATEAGVAQNAVSEWEMLRTDKQRMPTAYNLAKLCEALNVSADWLLFGEERR